MRRRSSSGRLLAATTVSEAVNRAAQLAGLGLAAWSLGAEGLAAVGEAWSLCNIVMAVVQNGSELSGMRAMGLLRGVGDHEIKRLATELSLLKFLIAVGVLPFLLLGRWLLGHVGPEAWMQMAMQYLAMLGLSQSYVWAFRGLERPFEQILLRLMQAGLSLGLMALFLWLRPQPLMVPAAEALAGILTALAGCWLLGGWAVPRRAGLDEHGRAALQLGIGSLLSNMGWQAPVLACARWAPAVELGMLSGALRLVLGGAGFLQVCLQSFYPALVRLFERDRQRATAATFALMLQAGILTLALIVVLASMADWLIPLFLGRSMAAAAGLFTSLLPLLLPVVLAAVPTYALLSRGLNAEVTLLQVFFALASGVASAVAFQLAPLASSAFLLHPLLWILLPWTLWLGHRRGVLLPIWSHIRWVSLVNPRRLRLWLAGKEA